MPTHGVTRSSSLAPSQVEDLKRLFGPDTAAGKQLRQLFPCKPSSTISSVRVMRSSRSVSQKPPPLPSPRPTIKYPKFRKSSSDNFSTETKPGRRPFAQIQRELEVVSGRELYNAPHPSVDKSKEKRTLQDKFRFSYATILPPGAAPPRVIFYSIFYFFRTVNMSPKATDLTIMKCMNMP